MLVKSALVCDVLGGNQTDWIVVFENHSMFNEVNGDVREADENDLYMKSKGYSCYTFNDLDYEWSKECASQFQD